MANVTEIFNEACKAYKTASKQNSMGNHILEVQALRKANALALQVLNYSDEPLSDSKGNPLRNTGAQCLYWDTQDILNKLPPNFPI